LAESRLSVAEVSGPAGNPIANKNVIVRRAPIKDQNVATLPLAESEPPARPRAADTQPRQRLALPLVAETATGGFVESKTYRALPLGAGRGSAFKSGESSSFSKIKGKFVSKILLS
jgi:hypothetical protein